MTDISLRPAEEGALRPGPGSGHTRVRAFPPGWNGSRRVALLLSHVVEGDVALPPPCSVKPTAPALEWAAIGDRIRDTSLGDTCRTADQNVVYDANKHLTMCVNK
jgi:hypothetical protein